MKYKSLDTLPMDIFLEIKKDPEHNIHLLSDRIESEEFLKIHWLKLESDFKKAHNKILKEGIPKDKITQELDYLRNKFLIINLCIKGLKLKNCDSEELINLLSTNDVEISKENRLIDLEKANEKNDTFIEFMEFIPENIEEFDFLDYHACWSIILMRFQKINEIYVTQYLNNYTEGINKIRLQTINKN